MNDRDSIPVKEVKQDLPEGTGDISVMTKPTMVPKKVKQNRRSRRNRKNGR